MHLGQHLKLGHKSYLKIGQRSTLGRSKVHLRFGNFELIILYNNLSLFHTSNSRSAIFLLLANVIERMTCKRLNSDLFTSEKRLYFCVRVAHLHPSETQNRQDFETQNRQDKIIAFV